MGRTGAIAIVIAMTLVACEPAGEATPSPMPSFSRSRMWNRVPYCPPDPPDRPMLLVLHFEQTADRPYTYSDALGFLMDYDLPTAPLRRAGPDRWSSQAPIAGDAKQLHPYVDRLHQAWRGRSSPAFGVFCSGLSTLGRGFVVEVPAGVDIDRLAREHGSKEVVIGEDMRNRTAKEKRWILFTPGDPVERAIDWFFDPRVTFVEPILRGDRR